MVPAVWESKVQVEHGEGSMPKTKEFLSVDGRDVPVSNLDKVMFPDGHVTKADVINYYLGVSEYLLPHLKNRPLTLKRYPNGAPGEFFYEKDAPSFTPEWVRTFPVPRRESKRKINYVLVDDRPTLAWLANLANLEIHPFLHRVPEINQPTSIVFDLDPGNGADVVTCARVALLLRDLLANFKLKSFPKVSGSKGLQVHVPLNTDVGYEVTQPFAKAVARILSEQHPKLIVAEMTKSLRTRKVFIDWSQNSDFKTTVAVYSLRAKVATAFVSLPVTWEELETAIERKNAAALFFTIASARDRLKRDGDLFKPVLNLKQRLPDAVSKHSKAKPLRLSRLTGENVTFQKRRNLRPRQFAAAREAVGNLSFRNMLPAISTMTFASKCMTF